MLAWVHLYTAPFSLSMCTDRPERRAAAATAPVDRRRLVHARTERRLSAAVDAVLKEAAAAGATIVKPAADTFWGRYYLWEVAHNPFTDLT